MRIVIPAVLAVTAALGAPAVAPAAAPGAVIADGLKRPESVCVGPGGSLYVTEMGAAGVDGDGRIAVIENGRARTFHGGLDDPKGLVFLGNSFYVTDKTRVLEINAAGELQVFRQFLPASFPRPPIFLNDLAVDVRSETLLVSDSGDRQGHGGAVYRIDTRSRAVETVADASTIPTLHTPNGVAFDGASFAMVVDFGTGELHRIRFADRSAERIGSGFEGADGLAWDRHGRLFVTSVKTGITWGVPRPGEKPVVIGERLQSAADCCLAADGGGLLVADTKAGAVVRMPTTIPGWEVDERPLDVRLVPAFPRLTWTGWRGAEDTGKVETLRPVVLTHFGDGSNRVVVATQRGVVHVFANSPDAAATSIFLDISARVRHIDTQNEEGLLGLAFHPKFAENGEFFVYYTDAAATMTNVVSRFRTRRDDRSVADPASEERLLSFDRPFWNHDGGTLTFGPDGHLYIAVGDGGSGGDPYGNAQNLDTLFGKVLRIDVDRRADGRPYAIPADNPFVGRPDARGEIWCFGLRNPWRIAFDRKTGRLWCADVGQNTFEEIDILDKGGNYGWSPREAGHPFGPRGVGVRPEYVEPIWEYDHDVGKSITGGAVYRGTAAPALDGLYLYADYVSRECRGLGYDAERRRVVANRPLPTPDFAVLSFGADERGELYLLGDGADGPAVMRLEPAAAAGATESAAAAVPATKPLAQAH